MKKYKILSYKIIKEIEDDVLKVGTYLESERLLIEKYQVTRTTLRRAFDDLSNQGYIEKSQGKQTKIISKYGKRKNILVIVPSLYKYIFSEILSNIEMVLSKNRMNMLISCSYGDHEIEKEILRNNISFVDGLIIEPSQAKKEFYDSDTSLSRKIEDIPCVAINQKISISNCVSLTLNDYEIMNQLTQDLVDGGSSSFLIIQKIDDMPGYDRMRGAVDAIENADLYYDLITYETHSEKKSFDSIKSNLNKKKYDVVIFYNDEILRRFCSEYNIDETLLVGFDNLDTIYNNENNVISPIHPKGEMGEDAANAIVKLIDGDHVDSKIYNVNYKKK